MSRAASTNYEIGKPRGVCDATGETIAPTETYMAVLIEPDPASDGDSNDGKLERVDVSLAAWERGYRPERLFAFWRTVMADRDASKGDRVDGGTLLELFDNLEDAEEPRRLAFRYVLALMLIRGRSLKQIGTPVDQSALLVVRKGEPDEAAVVVVEPSLDAEALRAVTEQVRAVMNLEG